MLLERTAACSFAADDGGVDGYYVSGVDIAVAVDVGCLTDKATGSTLLNEGIYCHYVSGDKTLK